MSGALAHVEIRPRDFRDVLAHVPTAVTVVTASHETEPVGMTVNSFTSVSLEPPLVLFCAAKSSLTWPRIRAARRFCVNVLAAGQEDLARLFSRPRADRFTGVRCNDRFCGPALADAVAWIDCELADEHAAGDHVIVLGAVLGVESTAAPPLVFHRRRYGTLVDAAETR